ncbi:MAG: GNAT family N-acetyltransferase [Burkholderiaceae bacterium]
MTQNLAPLAAQSIQSSHLDPNPFFPLAIEHYEAAIPPHMEQVLHTLYGNVFSSMPHFRVYGGLDDASTFILWKEQQAVAAFLYQTEDNQLRVLNEGMDVGEEAISAFSKFAFQKYASVDFISFNGIAHATRRLDFPFSQCHCTDDSVISLPDSPAAYLQSLGKATRKNIKQYLNRIQRDFPTFDFQIHDGRTADERFIRDIIALNRLRFERKGKISAITAEEEERILAMVRACGLVGSISIDGKFCAGSLVYQIGEHYHSWLKAHDPAYDEYRIGLIGSFLMISECIQRGGKTFHLMWGREPHKALLNSELRNFSNLTVYRDHSAALRNCGVLFRHAYQHGVRQGKLWLLDMEKGSGKISYPVRVGMSSLRKIKTWLPGGS